MSLWMFLVLWFLGTAEETLPVCVYGSQNTGLDGFFFWDSDDTTYQSNVFTSTTCGDCGQSSNPHWIRVYEEDDGSLYWQLSRDSYSADCELYCYVASYPTATVMPVQDCGSWLEYDYSQQQYIYNANFYLESGLCETSSPTAPSLFPSGAPSSSPSASTATPTAVPTSPSLFPSDAPSTSPTFAPSGSPSSKPTGSPTQQVTAIHTTLATVTEVSSTVVDDVDQLIQREDADISSVAIAVLSLLGVLVIAAVIVAYVLFVQYKKRKDVVDANKFPADADATAELPPGTADTDAPGSMPGASGEPASEQTSDIQAFDVDAIGELPETLTQTFGTFPGIPKEYRMEDAMERERIAAIEF